MRRAARKDWPQAAIVSALRQIGVEVLVVNQAGLPDILTHSRGVWLPIEIKQPGGRLTPLQQALQQRAPYPVVKTVAEALALFLGRRAR